MKAIAILAALAFSGAAHAQEAISLSGIEVAVPLPPRVAPRQLAIPMRLAHPIPTIVIAPAPPIVVLSDCSGYWVPAYLARGDRYRHSKVLLVVDGPVRDACSVMIDRNRRLVCLTPRAQLELSSVSVAPPILGRRRSKNPDLVDDDTNYPRINPYSTDVEAWIRQNAPGGQLPQGGAELRTDARLFYRDCTAEELSAAKVAG